MQLFTVLKHSVEAMLSIEKNKYIFPQCNACMSNLMCYNKHPDREGNGTPLQYACLENPMDGGAWWAAVPGVAKSRTRLSAFTFTFHFTVYLDMPWEN